MALRAASGWLFEVGALSGFPWFGEWPRWAGRGVDELHHLPSLCVCSTLSHSCFLSLSCLCVSHWLFLHLYSHPSTPFPSHFSISPCVFILSCWGLSFPFILLTLRLSLSCLLCCLWPFCSPFSGSSVPACICPPGLTANKPLPPPAPQEVLARLHEEAQLLAELSDQVAAVMWLKDGCALSPSPKYEVQASAGRQVLLVRDVVREDAGLYECVGLGSRTAYQLSVQGEGWVHIPQDLTVWLALGVLREGGGQGLCGRGSCSGGH